MQRKNDDHGAAADALPAAAPPVRLLAFLRHAHAEQLALCTALEDIADSLPAGVDRQKCIHAAKALGPLITGVHHYEETVFFPWLEAGADNGTSLHDTLMRLKFEHCEDACFAEELTDTLLRLGAGNAVNMEAAGYMLRGFFEIIRRHIAFEQDHLLRRIPDDAPVTPRP